MVYFYPPKNPPDPFSSLIFRLPRNTRECDVRPYGDGGRKCPVQTWPWPECNSVRSMLGCRLRPRAGLIFRLVMWRNRLSSKNGFVAGEFAVDCRWRAPVYCTDPNVSMMKIWPPWMTSEAFLPKTSLGCPRTARRGDFTRALFCISWPPRWSPKIHRPRSRWTWTPASDFARFGTIVHVADFRCFRFRKRTVLEARSPDCVKI